MTRGRLYITARRARRRTDGGSIRHCVRCRAASTGLPSAGPLPSTPSAAGGAPPALFGGFAGTMGPSDFQPPYITVVPFRFTARAAAALRTEGRQRSAAGSPGFRIRRRFPPREVPACVHGVSDHAEPGRFSRWRTGRCCLPKDASRRRSGEERFRGSIPSPHVPLSTLRPCPHGHARMTRGRCGSLDLHRMELSSTTPHRLCRRTRPRCVPRGLPCSSHHPSVLRIR